MKNPWLADVAACFGVTCHLHGTCRRYEAVEGNTNEHQVWMDHCGPEYSAYIPIIQVAAPRPTVSLESKAVAL